MLETTNQYSVMEIMYEYKIDILFAQMDISLGDIAGSVLSTLMIFGGAGMSGLFPSLGTGLIVGAVFMDDIKVITSSVLHRLQDNREKKIFLRTLQEMAQIPTLRREQHQMMKDESVKKVVDMSRTDSLINRIHQNKEALGALASFVPLGVFNPALLLVGFIVSGLTLMAKKVIKKVSQVKSSNVGGKRKKVQFEVQSLIDGFVDPESPRKTVLDLINRVSFEDYEQEFLIKLFKTGYYRGKYVFGITYKWTNTKSREYGYDVIMTKAGRTERARGTPEFRPVSSISVRFAEYIHNAIDPESINDIKEGTIAYDMRVAYDDAGGDDAGIKAIFDTFQLEIIDVMFLSESYAKDCTYLEILESFRMRDFHTKYPEGYNIAEGSAGMHVAKHRSGYAREALHEKIRHLISIGMESYKMSYYLGYHSYNDFLKEIKLATQSDTFEDAQFKFLGERMLSLIQQGYLTPANLEPFFPHMSVSDVFNFLARFNPNYIKCLVSKILIESKGKFTYRSLAKIFAVSKGTIAGWAQRNIKMTIDFKRHGFNWGGREKILFECYWRPLARLKVATTRNELDLLNSIGWVDKHLTLTDEEIYDRMECLFYQLGVGAPYQHYYGMAKRVYSEYTLHDLDAWFIRLSNFYTHMRLGYKILKNIDHLFFT